MWYNLPPRLGRHFLPWPLYSNDKPKSFENVMKNFKFSALRDRVIVTQEVPAPKDLGSTQAQVLISRWTLTYLIECHVQHGAWEN